MWTVHSLPFWSVSTFHFSYVYTVWTCGLSTPCLFGQCPHFTFSYVYSVWTCGLSTPCLFGQCPHFIFLMFILCGHVDCPLLAFLVSVHILHFLMFIVCGHVDCPLLAFLVSVHISFFLCLYCVDMWTVHSLPFWSVSTFNIFLCL